MLKVVGRPALFARFGRLVCVCMRNKLLSDEFRTRVRPLLFAGLACWCDRSESTVELPPPD